MLNWHFNKWIILFTLLFSTFHLSHAQKIDDLIEVSLLSDVEEIKSGESAWLLFQIELEPKWHAYWKTAGQTGFPTTIDWVLPDGVELGEVLFPSPMWYQFQDLVSYVHKDTFYLLTRLEVNPDAVFDQDVISLTAQFSTLICDEGNCIPFNKELMFEIPVSQKTIKSKVNSKKVQLALAKLPKSLPVGVQISALIQGDSLVLSFEHSSLNDLVLSGFNFFPDGDFITHGERQNFKKNGEGRISVQLSMASFSAGFLTTIKGLLNHPQFPQGWLINLSVDQVSYGVTKDKVEVSKSNEILKIETGFNQLLIMLGLILVAMSIWLYGKTNYPVKPSSTRILGRVLALSLLVFGVWLGYPQNNTDTINQIEWIPWTPEKVESLRADGRPVFIDFTARWCMSCQVNKVVYNKKAVIEKFKELKIVALQADWTKRGPVILKALQEFKREGVPLYVYYPARVKGEPEKEGILFPEILTENIVLTVIEEEKPFLEPVGDSFLAILGFAFLGGIILNLMPCVFPVLGLKIMSFVKQAGKDHKKVRWHGIIFTFGVILSFWILVGILLGLRETFDGEIGWGFQLQEPAFVFGLSIFLLIFALSLSGVFEIGLSLTGVGGQLSQKSGYLGSFFSGFLATIVATPCMAPFLGAAVGAALAMPWASAFVVFTSIAVGLSTPYLLLSIFPKWISRLPKPGEWMNTLKQGMAFPLYATVAWLLWTLNSLI
jgi:DsbC/DsbD-like thiol-disulfide interchange protein/cytochrome c biogenesis protein CcdA